MSCVEGFISRENMRATKPQFLLPEG